MHVNSKEQKSSLKGYGTAEAPDMLRGNLKLQVEMPFLKGPHVATGVAAPDEEAEEQLPLPPTEKLQFPSSHFPLSAVKQPSRGKRRSRSSPQPAHGGARIPGRLLGGRS